jgi:purine-cytosine permease-like protein
MAAEIFETVARWLGAPEGQAGLIGLVLAAALYGHHVLSFGQKLSTWVRAGIVLLVVLAVLPVAGVVDGYNLAPVFGLGRWLVDLVLVAGWSP